MHIPTILLALAQFASVAVAIVPIPSSYSNGSAVVWITPNVHLSLSGATTSHRRSSMYVEKSPKICCVCSCSPSSARGTNATTPTLSR